MSAPSDGARGDARKARAGERVAADERVVTVLDEHFIMWRVRGEGPGGEWFCSCGAKFGFSPTAVRHVAAELAGVIADAKVEAWDEGHNSGYSDGAADVLGCLDPNQENPYRVATS